MMSRIHLMSFLALLATSGTGLASTTISGVDYRAVPVGKTMTFTGSGFTGTSAVTFFWSPFVDSASFQVVSDTELKVTFPNVTQNIRDRFLLVESPSGSTVTMAGAVVEFSGTGTLPSGPVPIQVIIKAGAVLQGFSTITRVVYVKSGAVLQNVPASASNCVIFAENGATLDLRETTFSTSSPPRIFYSPGTTILGSLPAPTGGFGGPPAIPRQITSLSLSRDIGPFTLGIAVNVSVVGNGSVTSDPSGIYVPHHTNYTLTATPDPGWIFLGWSGSVTSSDPVVTANSGSTAQNIVATFTPGYTLETFSGSQGTITRDPEMDTYPPGQSVNLTASPAPGFQFVGWGGALAGSATNPESLAMDSNKIVTAVFEPTTPPGLPIISSVDYPAVPVGGIMTFTGSGFTETSAVTFLWPPYVDSAGFEVVSDTELTVTFPNVLQNIRDRFVLLESPNGSTVTMAGEVVEFTGIGTLPSSPMPIQVIVKAGAVLQGFSTSTRIVYVESGAVIKNVPSSSPGCVIFAEDGATLDLRGTIFSTSTPPRIFYSPGTTILGNLPAPSGGLGGSAIPRQITSLSLSRDIGPFTLGVVVNVSSVGSGSVSVDPNSLYIAHHTNYTLTATPDPGWIFQGWSGSVISPNPVVNANSGSTDQNIVATFTPGYTLETYSGSWGTITRDPELETYPPGQSVNLTASPAPGFQFVGWGGGLTGSAANPESLMMDSNKIVTAVFEHTAPPVLTHISSVDHPAVPVGGTMTFTGTGFTGTSATTFFWSPFLNAADFEVVSDTELKVIFPAVFQAIRDRFLLVETPSGSTVTMAGAVTEFTGTGSVTSSPTSNQIIAKAGSVLQGFPSIARVVYVESGAVLRNVPSSSSSCVIFVEDGATLDLRGTTFSTSSPPRIFYSPGTTILGNLPAPTGGLGGPIIPRQISSLSLSRDIGPFKEGFALNLTVEGPGSVSVDPIQDFHARGTAINLIATPAPGNFFVRWTGALSSTTNPVIYAINSSSPITARFSDRPDFFSDWRARYFLTPEELADPAISGLNADPDKDQLTNAGEYAFGTDPTVPNANGGLKILPGGNPHQNGDLKLEYVRPVFAADINYILQAGAGAGTWFDGKTGNITYLVTESKVEPAGPDMEKVTLLVTFTNEIPNFLFFQLTADITDLP